MRRDNLNNFMVCFLAFGTPFGLAAGLCTGDLITGFLTGVIAGGLFAGGMLIFLIGLNKKMEPVREQLMKEHEILFEGGANHFFKNEGVGGWLFLLEDKLHFISHNVNLNVHTLTVSYEDIVSIKKAAIVNTIQITLKNGDEERFVVNRRKKWIQLIEEHIK